MRWLVKSFEELTRDELYAVLQLRSEVFSVEQKIVYQDCDGRDQQALHVMAWDDEKLLAYARIFAPGIRYDDAAFGRVVTSPKARGTGLGKQLIQKCLEVSVELFPEHGVQISAQQYLEKFYGSHGFATISAPYIEEDIPHIKMHRKATA